LETIIDIVFAAALGISVLYTLLASLNILFELKSAGARPPGATVSLHPVSILKPIKGVDNQLDANLETFFQLDYPEYEILFGINEPDDPAIPIIQRLQKEYPGTATKLIVDTRRTGLNPKINNLANIYPHARHDFLLISDSNVRVKKNYLKDLISHFSDPKMGLVTSTIRGIGARNLGSRLENLHLNAHIAPAVFFARQFFSIPIAIGKSFLFKRETLEEIGGFWRFRNVLAEDHRMGEEIGKLGLKIRTTPEWIDNVNQTWSLRQFLNRHIRWAKMRKSVSELNYLVEVFSNPVAIGAVYAVVRHSPDGLVTFGAIIIFKTAIDFAINRLMKSDLKWYHHFLAPVKDILIGIVWYTPYLNRKINWRGNQFIIQKNTDILPSTKGA